MRYVYLLAGLLLLAGCATPEPVQAPPLDVTLVPSSTPPTTPAADLFSGIPSATTPDGFPALGATNAPVTVTDYSSYDSRASGDVYADVLRGLLPRIRAGEVRYVFVPLSGTGNLANGLAAARAALCAGEQGVFWPYHAGLFRAQDANAFQPATFTALAEQVGLDLSAWETCTLGDAQNDPLQAASSQASELESYAGTPTILVNGNFVLPDAMSIDAIIEQMLAQVDDTGAVAALPTPEDVAPEDAPPPETTPVELPSTVQESFPVPVDITLPPDWELTLNDTLLLNDIDSVRTIPFTLWQGPVPGGATGSIVLLWGFPNVTTGNLMAAEMGMDITPEPNLRIDGSRLLRLAVVEQGCNIGTDLEREYMVGGQAGTGTAWSAVDCPALPDTRGWFVGVREQGVNFLFYAYIEPIDPAGVTETERQARAELQSILNSVSFLEVNALPTVQVPATPLAETTP